MYFFNHFLEIRVKWLMVRGIEDFKFITDKNVNKVLNYDVTYSHSLASISF